MTAAASIPRAPIADGYDISRVIKGGWHLAGGHGEIDPATAVADMAPFVEAGITTFDCADIYTGVEELIGSFRRARPDLAAHLQVHTKFVPDLSELATLAPDAIEARIDRSCARLGVERLDLVQFHWWDYATPGYVEAALELTRLRAAGKIRHIGLTNFDTPHLGELVAAGVPVKTIQVQYSLLDARPEASMVAFCQQNGIQLLCYGTLAGGFLSERWRGREAPALETLTNRSLTKYRLIIDEFGGWPLFQELLETLQGIATRHDTDIATIASAAMLARPGVAAVIVGATNRAHLPANQQIANLQLSDTDLAAIAEILARRQGPDGEVYALERDRTGPHGRIMKYELGKPA